MKTDIELNLFPVVWGKEVFGITLPLHYSITDKTGEYVVLEYTVEHGRRLFENAIRVVTNSPNYDWHMTNLRNYAHLSSYPSNEINYTYNQKQFSNKPFLGSGLHGVPGDFTPPSRFIRMVAMVQFADKPKSSAEGVNLAFHILNSADIPKGVFEI